MNECQLLYPANPSSQHRSGQQASRRLRQAHDDLAHMLGLRQLGTDSDELIWTNPLTFLAALAATLLALGPELLTVEMPLASYLGMAAASFA